MLSCEDLHLIDPETGETREFDFIVDSLKQLSIWDEFSNEFNAIWPWAIWVQLGKTPEELILKRKKQRIQLGRYGRQSYDLWGDFDVDEFVDIYAALVDVMNEENCSGAEDK